MSLHYIIDAYNIINHTQFPRTYKKIQDHQRALLEFVKTERLRGSSKNKITFVFDGYPNLSKQKLDEADISVIFSRNLTADAMIKKMVEGFRHPKNIVVVSDDKEIRLFIKSLGAQSLGVEEFIIRKDKANGRPKGEVRDLLKPELSFSQMDKITQELRKIWLK